MVEATVQLGISPSAKRRNKIEGVEKEAYEELKEIWRREYHFRSDPRRRQRPICIAFCAADCWNLSAKDVIGDKNAQDVKFLKANARSALALNLHASGFAGGQSLNAFMIQLLTKR